MVEGTAGSVLIVHPHALWSRQPWEQVDDVGVALMPPGTVRVRGHTNVGGARSPFWGYAFPGSDHGLRLDASWNARCRGRTINGIWSVSLKFSGRESVKRLIVMGDFNQIIGPGSRARPELRLALQGAFPAGMTIATSDLTFQRRRCIDHIALSEDLETQSVGVISNIHGGKELSDHFGVVADVSVGYFQ